MEKLKEEESVTFESEHRTKDGRTFPVEITSHYLKHGGEEYEFVFVRDITEEKEAEKEIKQYRRGVEASDDSIYMIDKDYRYVFANDEHISRLVEDGKIFEKSEDEVIGNKYEDIHSEKDFEDFKKSFREAIETGELQREEYEFLTVDRWSSRTYSSIRDPDSGEANGVVVVSKDITERKKMEERLRQFKCFGQHQQSPHVSQKAATTSQERNSHL